MKVILRADIQGVGRRGDIVNVSDGHGRNYLLPKGLAIVASEGAVNQATAMRRARDLREAGDRAAAQTIAEALAAKTITIQAKAGNEGRLFGSVTAADVAAALEEQAGVVLDRKHIEGAPIRTTGSHSVVVRLHADVECSVNLSVVAG